MNKTLRQVVEHAADLIVSISEDDFNYDALVTGLTADSREIISGSLFLAIVGNAVDGHHFIDEAHRKGALLSIGEKKGEWKGYVQVASTLRFAERISAFIYDNPTNNLHLFGITGTNGKTTTAYMLEKILTPDLPVGVTGTVGYRFGTQELDAPNTTPFIWKWYEVLHQMVAWGAKGVISEVSSHALDQRRIAGTEFDVVLFTNLSQDHLDYHKTIEAYSDAKKLLFSRHAKKDALFVCNVDDIYGQTLSEEFSSKKMMTYAIDHAADLSAQIINERADGIIVRVTYEEKTEEFLLPFRAKFNVSNALAAAAAASRIVNPFVGFKRLTESFSLAGRLEKVGARGHVFVDYAHTPDALLRVTTALKQGVGNGRLLVVFGAGGDRDRGKREKMGEVVAQIADHAIVTSDNPRTENPSAIIEDIIVNMDGSLYTVIEDRAEAIRFALTIATDDDTVLIAGKGHEEYQIIGRKKSFFSDKEIVLKYFNT